ncbi:MAG TPA: hypothetical protein VKV40_23550 [Ktedonobacteraceae bacterium]|nr:hypothetical protein [Ktedonobacteraceae bacterium]
MNALPLLLVHAFFPLSLAAAIATTIFVWVKRRRFPRSYGLLIVAVLLISSSALFFLFMQSQTRVKLASGIEAIEVKETDVANLAIQTLVSIPADTDQPVQVDTDLTSPSGLSQPTPVGTPGVPIIKAFGSGYDLFVTARLNADAFDVVPQKQPEQAFGQPGAFTWTLTPKSPGYQSLEVMVTGRWVPRSGGSAIERLLADQSFSFYVATPPGPTFSSEKFFGLLAQPFLVLFVTLLSLLLNVPWIAELLKKRPETKKG